MPAVHRFPKDEEDKIQLKIIKMLERIAEALEEQNSRENRRTPSGCGRMC